MSERIHVGIREIGDVKWDNAITADQQARTLITILTAEIAVMRKRMIQLEAEVANLRGAVERAAKRVDGFS